MVTLNEIREILTKAVIGKGRRKFDLSVMMPKTVGLVHQVLGTAMINHEVVAKKVANQVEVAGSCEVNVWYTYDGGKSTDITRLDLPYDGVIQLENGLREHLLDSDEIMAEEVVAPYATDVRISSGVIHVDVSLEVMAEVIGETKMRVAILGPVIEPITPEITFDPDDDLAEIDGLIEPNFLEATILPFD